MKQDLLGNKAKAEERKVLEEEQRKRKEEEENARLRLQEEQILRVRFNFYPLLFILD